MDSAIKDTFTCQGRASGWEKIKYSNKYLMFQLINQQLLYYTKCEYTVLIFVVGNCSCVVIVCGNLYGTD